MALTFQNKDKQSMQGARHFENTPTEVPQVTGRVMTPCRARPTKWPV
jgi:hypothetical protein